MFFAYSMAKNDGFYDKLQKKAKKQKAKCYYIKNV